MTTSSTTAWSMTARDHVVQALKKGRIISSGEVPTADEMADCTVEFNGLLKSWGAKASNLWRDVTAPATVDAGNPEVALEDDVADVTAVRVVISATNQRQLFRWERDQYQMLPNKAASGSPTIYYVSESIGAPSLFVWPVPPADTTLSIDYLRMPETITDPGQTVDFPERYQEALYTNLAVNCWGLFRDEDPPAWLTAKAAILERELLDASRPAAYWLWSASD
jgi:hypothetical protein